LATESIRSRWIGAFQDWHIPRSSQLPLQCLNCCANVKPWEYYSTPREMFTAAP
jgi:hypothetical protein